ncbi:ABC transporter substrate-binding protein [Desulfococcaceae bacterium HSG8]|nr:ABC transporter substrate-binding protein [Desulfococcaceae bacterium HSG8]
MKRTSTTTYSPFRKGGRGDFSCEKRLLRQKSPPFYERGEEFTSCCTNRRDFLKSSVRAAAIMAAQAIGIKKVFAGKSKKFQLNVGYLPITDHLILPVSHALDNSKYSHVNVKMVLCKSWDEILGKVEMGMLHAAFMLTPLAMYKVMTGSPMKCLLLGHTNGSVIAVKKSITDSEGLVEKTIGIPHSKSTHRVLLYKYLKSKGMENRVNLRLVKIPPPLTVKSLKAGRIDAYTVAEPWGIRGITEGVANILEFSKNIIPNHVCCIVMVKNRVIEKQPDAISEWVRSLRNAGSIIHSDPDRAGLLQEPYMKHRPDEIVQVIKDDLISYVNLEPDRKKLCTISDLALECGILPAKCDFDQFIDNRFA